MAFSKVEVTRHNAKAASKNNVIPGSNTLSRPSLIGGGGSPGIENNQSNLVVPPPPIKREKSDYCRDGSCGSPWTLHLEVAALQQHIRFFFCSPPDQDGNCAPYGKWGSMPKVLGPDTTNEVIKRYRSKHQYYVKRGEKIKDRAAMFHVCRVEVESDMEPMLEASNVERAWAGLEKPKMERHDHGQKYLDDYMRHRGNNAR